MLNHLSDCAQWLCTVIDKVTARMRDFLEVNKEQKHTDTVTDMPVDEGKEV